jgi:hypothetical protein
MTRASKANAYGLLLTALRTPAALARLDDVEWMQLLAVAADNKLAGRVAADAARLPSLADGGDREWLRNRLDARRALNQQFTRAIIWEIGRVRRALADLDVPWVLLKGAAYVAADLPMSAGRMVSDIDILVPERALPDVERCLTSAGWNFPEISAYDNRYYREWMHELPPMVHEGRKSVLDVHHAILPRTSRLGASSEDLLARTQLLPNGLRVLAPADQVLHAAVHLFHDGEVVGGLRDLVDLDGLLRHNDTDGFWDDLLTQTTRQGLGRPLYYALRFAQRHLATPIPQSALASLRPTAPGPLVSGLMDALVDRVLVRGHRHSSLAGQALYARSHWLKMPPALLAAHLARKLLPFGGH